MTTDKDGFDAIILDIGGDEVIRLTGPLANPEQVAREVEKARIRRTKRLAKATLQQLELFTRWKQGREPIYARRFVNMPDEVRHHTELGQVPIPGGHLAIYLSAPALREALTAEINLGADASDLVFFTNQSLAGMIFGTFFSVLEPNGESGSCHVCDLEEIPFEAMEAASKKGWLV